MTTRNIIDAGTAVSIADLRQNPEVIIDEAGRLPVPVCNHNRVIAYIVSANVFEAMLEKLDDIDLARLVRERRGESTVKVSLEEL